MDVKKTDKLSPALIEKAQNLRSLYYGKKE
jgi:hypothetical protein